MNCLENLLKSKLTGFAGITIVEDTLRSRGIGKLVLRQIISSLKNKSNLDTFIVAIDEPPEYYTNITGENLPTILDVFSSPSGWSMENEKTTSSSSLMEDESKIPFLSSSCRIDDLNLLKKEIKVRMEDRKANEMETKKNNRLVVVVDCLSAILQLNNLQRTLSFLIDLMEILSAAIEDICNTILKLETKESLQLYHVLSKERKIALPNTAQGICSSLQKRSTGKILEGTEYFDFSMNGLLTIVEEDKKELKQTQQIEALTFKLGISEREKLAKDALVLPYEQKNITENSTNLLYIDQTDVDWNDDDVDDDIDDDIDI